MSLPQPLSKAHHNTNGKRPFEIVFDINTRAFVKKMTQYSTIEHVIKVESEYDTPLINASILHIRFTSSPSNVERRLAIE